jgi:hypothetical protein
LAVKNVHKRLTQILKLNGPTAPLLGRSFTMKTWNEADGERRGIPMRGKVPALILALALVGSFALVRPAISQSFVAWPHSIPAMPFINSTHWVDVDNDGDLDLFMTGVSNRPVTRVYLNDGTGVFTELGQNLRINGSAVAWFDLDADGDLDMLISGDYAREDFGDSYWPGPTNAVFLNDGHGLLQHGLDLPGSSVAVGDVDNDGAAEIHWRTASGRHGFLNVVRNGNSLGYVAKEPGFGPTLYGVTGWRDLDRDGDLDAIFNRTWGNGQPTVQVYRNEGGLSFLEIPFPVYLEYADPAWADYDGDGYLDAVAHRYEPTNGQIMAVFHRNNGADGWISRDLPVGSPNKLSPLDFDGDGRWDFFWPTAGEGTSYYVHRLYRNVGPGPGTFLPITHPFAPLDRANAALGDFNGDGTPDVLLTGGDPTSQFAIRVHLYRNQAPPKARPSALTGLQSQVSGNGVRFSWNPSNDGATPASSLSYDLRVGRQPGGIDIVAPVSHPITGVRRLPQPGAIVGTEWRLQVNEPGTYYWSVQAINSGWQGSAWAPEQMVIVTNTPPVIEIAREIRTWPSRLTSVPMTIADAESSDEELQVTAGTLQTGFVPAASIAVQGASGQRVLQFRVAPGVIGTNLLWVRVSDPQGLFTEVRLRIVSELFTAEPVPGATNFQSLIPLPTGYSQPLDPPIADFDGDGDLDVLYIGTFLTNNAIDAGYFLALNDGLGNFHWRRLPEDLPVGGNGYWLDDFDRDGDVDVLARGDGHGNGAIRLAANNGRGEFGPAQELGPDPLTMLADVDGDGDLDGFLVSELRVDYYENVHGQFHLRPVPLTRFDVAAELGAARVGDFDSDGDIDFFIPTAGTNFTERLWIRTLRNMGRGRFLTESQRILGTASTYGMWSYDVDDDSDLDVSFWYSTSFSGAILRGHALSDSTGHFYFSTNALANDPVGGDFNNDGQPDRFMSELIDSFTVRFRYRLGLKTGPGRYVPQPFSLSETGLAADFDGDGKLDLLAMTEEQDESGFVVSPRQLRFYRNRHETPNAPPPTPGGLAAVQEVDDVVRFQWNAVTDDHTAAPLLTYNVRVGTTPGGSEILTSESDPVTGRRRVVLPGNAGPLTFRKLAALPPGTYYWTVQAVDYVRLGSAWAPEQSITIRKPEISFLADVVTPPGIPSVPISVTINGGTFSASAVQVSAVSDDPAILPATGLVFTGSGSQRQLTLTPGPASGDTDVSIIATDPAGFRSVARFHVRVAWWDARRLEQLGIQRYEYWTWADLNADGRLDLMSHSPGSINQSGAFSYRNLASGGFQEVSNNLPFSVTFATQVGATGGDDLVDALTVENLSFRRYVWRVWQGTGSDSEFVAVPAQTNEAAVSGAVLWVDLDNDGRRDVAHFGWASTVPSNGPTWGVVAARGNLDGSFTYYPWIQGISSGQSLAAGDFDGDGDFDLIASGANYSSSGSLTGYVTRIYFNAGGGRFTPSTAGLPQGNAYNVSVVDFDQDGQLDVMLSPAGLNGPASLMRNVGAGEFVEHPAAFPTELNLARWADYDNDGDPDLLAITTTQFPSTGSERYRAAVFNNNFGIFSRADTGLPEIVAHQADFADADNDGDLDLLISGEQGWNHTGRVLGFNTSPRRNLPPPPPTNLDATSVLSGALLHWTAPIDPESGTALSYNLRLGTTPGGSDVVSALADPGTGTRRVSGPGNIGHAPRWRMDLPDGTYYWSVQAIDAGFAASPFSEEKTLVISRPKLSALSDVVLKPFQVTEPIPFTISNGTPPFTVTAEVANPQLLPPGGLVLDGVGRARALIIRAGGDRAGTTTVTIKVIDAAGGQDFVVFNLVVLPAFEFSTDLRTPSVGQGALLWGDADRDGDLDLLVTGGRYDTSGFRANILRNDRSGLFTSTLAELNAVSQGGAAWVDVDRDDDLDAVITGLTDSQNASTTLYRNAAALFTPLGTGQTRLLSLGSSLMAWADADGDGDPDVVVSGTASGGSRDAGLFLNDGNGSFSNSLVAVPAVTLGAVAWADYDGDGDADFVLTGTTDGGLIGATTRLYRNGGHADFVEVPTSWPALYRSAASWADYDRDGDPDLLLAGLSATGPVTTLWRNEGGTFTRVLMDLPGVADGALAWGDANLDGYPDLALAGRTTAGSGPLLTRVYWNQHGSLIDSGTPLPGLHLAALAWGDLQNDGLLDLAMSGSTNVALTLYNGGTYSGVYRNNLPPPAPGSPNPPTGLLATVNGSDVVLSWNPTGGTGSSYDLRVTRVAGSVPIVAPMADGDSGYRRVAQAGAAGWSARWTLRNLLPGTYAWSAQTVDAAYRGSLFVAGADFTIVNQPPTITGPGTQTMGMNNSLGPLPLLVTDPDGDPALLNVTVSSSNPRVIPPEAVQVVGTGSNRSLIVTPVRNEAGSATLIFTVQDSGGGRATASFRVTVQSLIDLQAGFPDGQFSVLEPADFDLDGDLDVLVAGTQSTGPSSGQATVHLYRNLGNATFLDTTPAGLPPVFDGAIAAWGDFDQDGDPDLFYDGIIYRNNGALGFAAIDSTLNGIHNGQAAWGDFDQDGDLDLVVSGNLGIYVTRLLRNEGGSFFTVRPDLLRGLHYSRVAWGDADGDGDLDLAIAGAAAANTAASANAWLYRNDNGSLVEVRAIFGAVNGRITWADVNGDGRADLDIVGSNGGSPLNHVLLNLGDWRFTSFLVQPGGINWVDVRLLDWDGDGDVDFLGGVNSLVIAYLNPGTGIFPSGGASSVSLRCRTLGYGDFDRDAVYDVIVGNVGSTGLTGQNRLYRNLRVPTTPPAPASPNATVLRDEVTLAWPVSPPILGAPVTYNVRIGHEPNIGDVLSPLSRVDGRRLVAQDGNAGFSTQLRLRQLPPGTYHWAVQTVDASWRGGPWRSNGTFTIGPWPPVSILSFEAISPGQWRLRFSAPAGRQVGIEASADFNGWTEIAQADTGIAGTNEAIVTPGGSLKFLRLVLKP